MTVSTQNVPAADTLDEVVGNVTEQGAERTARQTISKLATQLMGTDPIANRFSEGDARASAATADIGTLLTRTQNSETSLVSLDDRTEAVELLTAAMAQTVDNLSNLVTGQVNIVPPVHATHNGHKSLGQLKAGNTVDGDYELQVGDKFLSKDHNDPSWRGIFIVGAANTTTRWDGMDAAGEFKGAVVPVMNGQENGGTFWGCTSEVTTVGTDPVEFASLPVAISVPRGAWVTNRSYKLHNTASLGNALYQCTQAHLSAAASEPGVGVDWQDYWFLLIDLSADASEPMIVPDVISAVEGIPCFIGTDACLSPGNKLGGVSITVDGFPTNSAFTTNKGQTEAGILFTPTAAHPHPQPTIFNKIRRRDGLILESKNVPINFRAKANLTGKVIDLMIGPADSINAPGSIAYWTKHFAEKSGMTLNLHGHQQAIIPDVHDPNNPLTGAVVNVVAKPGASSTQFATLPNWSGGSPSTNYDNPAWDGAQYNHGHAMIALGNPALNAQVIFLGTNSPIFLAKTDAQAVAGFTIEAANLETFIASTHAHNSNTHVLVAMQLPAAASQEAYYNTYGYRPTLEQRRRNLYTVSRLLQAQFGDRTGNRVHVFNSLFAMNPYTGFPFDGCQGTMTFDAATSTVTTGSTKVISNFNLMWQKWARFVIGQKLDFQRTGGMPMLNTREYWVEGFTYEAGHLGDPDFRTGLILGGQPIVDEGPLPFVHCRKQPLIALEATHPYGDGEWELGAAIASKLAAIGAWV